MPHEMGKMFQDLTDEYEANETAEARLAHDADKVETLLQAIEYEAQGHDTEAWKDTSLAALRTDAGRELARAIGSADPQWWSPFAASYHELRASTRARRQLEQDEAAALFSKARSMRGSLTAADLPVPAAEHFRRLVGDA